MTDSEREKQTNLQFWVTSIQFWRGKNLGRYGAMYHYNRARRNLARAIREAETKLNRPHRHLPKLGCVQYTGASK